MTLQRKGPLTVLFPCMQLGAPELTAPQIYRLFWKLCPHISSISKHIYVLQECIIKSCAEWERTNNISLHTDVHYVKKFLHTKKSAEVKI